MYKVAYTLHQLADNVNALQGPYSQRYTELHDKINDPANIPNDETLRNEIGQLNEAYRLALGDLYRKAVDAKLIEPGDNLPYLTVWPR